MKRVLYLRADDWYAIYIDGKSISQHHTLQPMELLEFAEKHQFSHSDVASHWATEEDEERCMDVGGFPPLQSELKGSYA